MAKQELDVHNTANDFFESARWRDEEGDGEMP